MNKKIFFISALLLCGTISAQSTDNNAVVNVENEYTPEVIKVNKKGHTPTVAQDIEMAPLELEFAYETLPFKEFTSERDVKGIMPRQQKQYPGYARLGYGCTNDIDAKLAYTLKTSKNGKVGMHAALDGFSTDSKGIDREWDRRMFRTALGAMYTHKFKSLKIGVTADFSNRVFNYQSTEGYNTGITDKQNSRIYSIKTYGMSYLKGDFSYSYDAGITYNRRSYSSGMEEGTGELRFMLGGRMEYKVGENMLENMGIELGYDGFLYNSTLRNTPRHFNNFSSFDVNPYLTFDIEGWNIKVGTKMNFITANGARFAIAPDIRLKGNITDAIGVYGEITGGREANSLAAIEEFAPYWGFDNVIGAQLLPTYRIVDTKIGSHITTGPYSFDVYAGYAYTKDDILQSIGISSGSTMYRLVYSDIAQQNTHDIFIGAGAGCNLGNWMKLSAEVRYDKWIGDNKDLLMMKPMLTFDINLEYRIIEDLTLRAGYNLTFYTRGYKRNNSKNELYARASYQIFDWLGAYIQGDNLLNCDYYEYAGYRALRARGSLGVTANF